MTPTNPDRPFIFSLSMNFDDLGKLKPGDPVTYSQPDPGNRSAFRFKLVQATFVRLGQGRVQISFDGHATWVSMARITPGVGNQLHVPSG